MFTQVDFIITGIPGLIDAIQNCFEIEGQVLSDGFEGLKEYCVDSYYVDFETSGRCDLPQALIYQFKPTGKFYRIWREEDLFEIQETYFETQVPEIVSKQRITINIWKEIKSDKKPEGRSYSE